MVLDRRDLSNVITRHDYVALPNDEKRSDRPKKRKAQQDSLTQRGEKHSWTLLPKQAGSTVEHSCLKARRAQ